MVTEIEQVVAYKASDGSLHATMADAVAHDQHTIILGNLRLYFKQKGTYALEYDDLCLPFSVMLEDFEAFRDLINGKDLYDGN